ncbi:MAG TPA: hypothetical protein VFP80_03320 [Thermoanaerobaculia bacterium]|nr:hypothetical protein [Thermoanaerobaculia bacterium]
MNEGRTRFRTAAGSDMREFALLWLVFSVLDVLVKDTLTFRWLIGNVVFSGVLWALGAYI